MLRGELRPNILQQSLEPMALEQLIRNTRKVAQKSQLIELEFAINDVLQELVNTKDIYSEDKKTRDAAIHARANKIMKSESKFQYVGSEVILTDILPLPDLNTPLLRFYNTLLDAEILRTRLATVYLCRAVQDDVFMRSTLKELFRKIKNSCREAMQWDEHRDVMRLIPIKLTHLYFSLYHTYRETLASYTTPEYEDDFMDFVYNWKGEYPSSEVESKYNKLCNKRTDIGNTIVIPGADSHITQESNKPARAKDKADVFLENVTEFNFLEMPKIKALSTHDKVRKLVLTMLETPGHACAMLEYLGFYEWIKNTQRAKFNKDDYDALCTKIIMCIENSRSFHTVRMSLNPNNKVAEKYRAYTYLEQVDNEYGTLVNS